MKVLVVHDKPDFAAQIAYTFDALLSSLGLAYELLVWPDDKTQLDDSPVILYGSQALKSVPARHKLHIHSSDFFGPHYLATASSPRLPLDWVLVDGKRLPILYQASSPLAGQPVLVTISGTPLATHSQGETGSLLCTNLDLVASSFFMLSRYEEAPSQERDQYDRFPLEANLSVREGFWRTPIVNLYARLLKDWLQALGMPAPQPPNYPGARPFGLCLTHDVDNPRKFTPLGLLKTVAKVMLRRETRQGWRQIGAYLLTRRDPFWNFDQIINLEQAHGFHSTFFLVAGRRRKAYDPSYGDDLEERERLCETILDLGGEIGLHGSFDSYLSAEILGAELQALNRHAARPGSRQAVRPGSRQAVVSGGRQHFLRLDVQRSFSAMEQAGLLYDCTLGFSGALGFRSGFAGPHRVFNLAENRPFRLVEIPLIIMDRSMWAVCCQGMSPGAIWDEMLQVLEPVRAHNGCASILWHNGFFDEAAFPGYSNLYRSLLSWLQENNGWGASAKEVHDWFVK